MLSRVITIVFSSNSTSILYTSSAPSARKGGRQTQPKVAVGRQ